MSNHNTGEDLSELTKLYLKQAPKQQRSKIGQFFTPRLLREALCAQISFRAGMKILDPGVGTGEFLKTCSENEKSLYLEGWDIDQGALDVAKQLVPEAVLKLTSALDEPFAEKFDVVIGNPPYFEIPKIDASQRNRFSETISGRPNIFALFFKVGLEALKPGGYLGYVVPPSMNNGAFFSKLRKYISENSSIEYLKVFTDPKLFIDAQTAVQLLVLKKGGKGNKFTLNLGSLSSKFSSGVLFSEKPSLIEETFLGRNTLWDLGYEAITGSLVWNQHKEDLRSVKEDGAIPLLWAHNITEQEEVVLNDSHPKKPQYVISKEFLQGPAIIVNRITGTVGKGSLRCALIPEGMKFLGENHVNVIRKRPDVDPILSFKDLLELLRVPDINKRIQQITGNTQISCRELTYLIPLDSQKIALAKNVQQTLFV